MMLLSLSLALAAAPLLPSAAPSQDGLQWRSIEEATIEGRPFEDRAAPYDRLPADAEGSVRAPVWRLQGHSAGMAARFVTDAKEIHVRWTLTSDELEMHHMPSTGVSGLDLYGRDETGTWRWMACARPKGVTTTSRIVGGLDGKEREAMLYLPLYNGVSSVEIGLPDGASFGPGPARPRARALPVVFYGTSITQGASASRPGMTHAAQLGRRLDRPVVNLGFSGNGRMEIELAELLSRVDAAAYVIDCLPNMSPKQVAERAAPFVRRLRQERPLTPILLVEDRTFADAPFRGGRGRSHAARRAALRAAFDELSAEIGEAPDSQDDFPRPPLLSYLEGSTLLGLDGEGTVDGSHPTDLGFARQADAFEPALREILWQPRPLRVLLLGDSISIGYTSHVRRQLASRAVVVRANRGLHSRVTDNCAGTTKGVQHLDRWLAQDGGDWDVIHFNFGMHDLKRVDGVTGANSDDPADPRQAEPEVYERQLREIVTRLRATGATLVFATSTPVPEGGVSPHRDPADVALYNGIARRVMEQNGVVINDLCALVEASPVELQRPVDVHFTPEGSKALGQQVVGSILAAVQGSPSGAAAPVPSPTTDAVRWRSVEDATIEGRPFRERAGPYDRLPAEAEGSLGARAWRLQRHSAGIVARFVTDAKEMHGRWTATSDPLERRHLPSSGAGGLDLYGRDEAGAWRWVACAHPTGVTTTAPIVGGLDGEAREYMLYLPLSCGVSSVEIGLPEGASFAPGPARSPERALPIVFYGTSITQGASASRPGMAHVAQLGRRLDRPVVNLGLAGHAGMEIELAELLARIDAAAYVVDCLPDMTGEMVAERAVPFVRRLREARPGTPILLVEDRTLADEPFRAPRGPGHGSRRAALMAAHGELVRDVTGLFTLEGAGLLGIDGEGTADGVHPTDLGYVRQADTFEPRLREILGQPRPARVLLLGDSISVEYTPHVRRGLAGRATVFRANRALHSSVADSCDGTAHGLENLDRWLAQEGGEWDVIHFNFGLHDLKRVDPVTGQDSKDPADPRQADPEIYERRLQEIVGKLRATGATLIFATSTPVPEGGAGPHRDPADVALYNAIARKVMEENGVAINDLYAFVESSEATLQRPMNVHFTPAGSKALGERVAEAILREFQGGSAPGETETPR